jgi:hypothetical protein
VPVAQRASIDDRNIGASDVLRALQP